MWLGRPTWAEIDLDAIAFNVQALRRRAGTVELIAAVKANAYGHGVVPVVKVALEAGATRLAVGCVDEGIQLRRNGIGAPILIIGPAHVSEAPAIVQFDLTPTVATRDLALALEDMAQERDKTVSVHLEIDTGMARFGLLPDEVEAFYKFLTSLSHLTVEGVYTHFATSDESNKAFTRQQFDRFCQVAERLPLVRFRHVANSAAIIDLPEMSIDAIRPGIAIYGVYPSREVERSIPLRPALSLKSRVARVRALAVGESVSYGRTWTASRPTRVALIPCGYADGLRRSLSNQGEVLIRGRRAPIRGRVCMDQTIVDVTDIDDIAIDDEVVIIGRQGDDEISADEIADRAGTISYEVLTGIPPRVPRRFLRNGKVIAVETLVDPPSIT